MIAGIEPTLQEMFMSGRRRLVFLLMPLVGACAVVPTGPSRMALPGSTMSFEQFRYDDAVCRQYALEQSGAVTAGQAGQESVARSAVLGTVIGAAAGAAMGGSHGAGVGAGTGLLFGSMAGTGAAQASGYSVQQRYDQGYVLRKRTPSKSSPWVCAPGPLAVLALVHCSLAGVAGPRSVHRLAQRMAAYGISVDHRDIARNDLGNQLRMLGLVLDSPDAETGMLLIPPFAPVRPVGA